VLIKEDIDWSTFDRQDSTVVPEVFFQVNNPVKYTEVGSIKQPELILKNIFYFLPTTVPFVGVIKHYLKLDLIPCCLVKLYLIDCGKSLKTYCDSEFNCPSSNNCVFIVFL
jgi:hypothetical protein